MLNIRGGKAWAGWLAMLSMALAGCAPKTNVSTTGNVPAQYSHVFMTVREIWFHTDAAAGPDDTAWIKYALGTPVTVDLVSSMEGTVTSLTTGLNVPIGTYAQLRLIPVDAGSPLEASAQSASAKYNFEADYVDSGGSHQVPLELQNPEKGIGIQTSIQVKGSSTNVFASSNTNTSTSTGTNSTTGTTKATPVSVAINIDGAKGLVAFEYGPSSIVTSLSPVSAVLLNPHLTAYDSSLVGAIKGTLDVSGLTNTVGSTAGSYLDIQVTAESLSTDGTRHVAVNSTPVRSDGSFTLYPLSTSASSPTSYDLVIHGPAMATTIIKGVSVTPGDPTSTTPVSVGTITARAAQSFLVNLNTATPLQAGALVGFYQTLPGSNEVPYLIEQRPIDPFSRTFSTDQSIASGTLYNGSFSSSGSAISLTPSKPAEGGSTYRVAATAPLFADGVMTTTVTAPSGGSTATTLVPVPQLLVASGAASNTTTFTISQVTANKYDQGYLIVSHDGAIVATTALDTALARGGASSLAISGIPAGGGSFASFRQGLYYVSVRVWNSTNPGQTLNRETYPTALDLRNSSIASYSLRID